MFKLNDWPRQCCMPGPDLLTALSRCRQCCTVFASWNALMSLGWVACHGVCAMHVLLKNARPKPRAGCWLLCQMKKASATDLISQEETTHGYVDRRAADAKRRHLCAPTAVCGSAGRDDSCGDSHEHKVRLGEVRASVPCVGALAGVHVLPVAHAPAGRPGPRIHSAPPQLKKAQPTSHQPVRAEKQPYDTTPPDAGQ